ncbi:MAG: hypothetical protein AAFY66_17000 [Pseudomonadota bacterium]
MTMTRRRLLTNGVGLIAVVAMAEGSRRFVQFDVEDTVEAILRHYLGDDGLVPGAAAAFARDYGPVTTKNWKFEMVAASGLYLLPSFREALPSGLRQRVEHYDRRVVTDFLLSSSYDGTASEEPLDYFALNTDAERFCNPFARFRDDI